MDSQRVSQLNIACTINDAMCILQSELNMFFFPLQPLDTQNIQIIKIWTFYFCFSCTDNFNLYLLSESHDMYIIKHFYRNVRSLKHRYWDIDAFLFSAEQTELRVIDWDVCEGKKVTNLLSNCD